MTVREIVEWKVNLKDQILTKEQQARDYDLMGEHNKAFS